MQKQKSEILYFSLGRFKCTALFDGYYTNGKASVLFRGASRDELPDLLQKYNSPQEGIHLPCTCLLVDTGEEKILFDTGYGLYAKGNPFAEAGRMPKNLHDAGFYPGEINKVLISHCDGDHIGGTVDEKGRPLYENARYYIAEKEWNHWKQQKYQNHLTEEESKYYKKYLFSLEQVINFFPEGEIATGISAIPSPGHSAGHTVFRLESQGEILYYISDTVCHGIHFEKPGWQMTFEHDPLLAAQNRVRLFEKINEEKAIVFAFHMPFPGLGRIEKRKTGYNWKEIEEDDR